MTEKFIEIINSVKPDVFENPGADLIEEGILDSLDVMSILTTLEGEYNIDFDPDDISPENFASAETIWALIEKTLASG